MSVAPGPPWSSLEAPLRCAGTIQRKFGFPSMTPVQAACIPAFLSHKDVSVQACTGSGKTLAFVIPMIEMLLRRREPPQSAKKLGKYQIGAIIISPTRELADQILEVTKHFTDDYPEFVLMGFVGGKDVRLAEMDFKTTGANIIVATPGMLLAMLNSVPLIDVQELELLVLDEADRLLDMGFEKTIDSILPRLPKQRRTGLFSATQTAQIAQLARAGLRNPVQIELSVQYTSVKKKKKPKKKKKKAGAAEEDEKGEDAKEEEEEAKEKEEEEIVSTSVTPSSLQNYFMMCTPEEKVLRLLQFLLENKQKKIIVFFLTCASVDYFAKVLPELECCKDLNIVGMHGKQLMKKRTANFKQFSSHHTGVLLCTDVAARGIDIPDVDCIVQFDPPQDPDMFVHRIGRTARMGRTGMAVVFLLPKEDAYISFLRLKRVPIEEAKPASLPSNLSSVVDDIRTQAMNDRAVMEKGQNAFVSFIRGYKEHQCGFIFVFTQLPFSELAKGWGLLYFPRMSDLKHFNIKFDSCPIKAYDIKFKDKQREAQRLANLDIDKAKRDKEQKDREEKEKKYLRAKENAGPKRRNKKVYQEMADEWDDLAKESRFLKKLKKGLITKEEYEASVGGENFN